MYKKTILSVILILTSSVAFAQKVYEMGNPNDEAGSKYSSTSGLSPRGHLERQAVFHASTQDEA